MSDYPGEINFRLWIALRKYTDGSVFVGPDTIGIATDSVESVRPNENNPRMGYVTMKDGTVYVSDADTCTALLLVMAFEDS